MLLYHCSSMRRYAGCRLLAITSHSHSPCTLPFCTSIHQANHSPLTSPCKPPAPHQAHLCGRALRGAAPRAASRQLRRRRDAGARLCVRACVCAWRACVREACVRACVRKACVRACHVACMCACRENYTPSGSLQLSTRYQNTQPPDPPHPTSPNLARGHTLAT